MWVIHIWKELSTLSLLILPWVEEMPSKIKTENHECWVHTETLVLFMSRRQSDYSLLFPKWGHYVSWFHEGPSGSNFPWAPVSLIITWKTEIRVYPSLITHFRYSFITHSDSLVFPFAMQLTTPFLGFVRACHIIQNPVIFPLLWEFPRIFCQRLFWYLTFMSFPSSVLSSRKKYFLS